MRCEYIFTYDDYLESLKAYRKVVREGANAYWMYVWIWPAIGFAAGVFFLIAYLRHGEGGLDPLFWPACIGFGVAFALPASYRSSLKRGFKNRNALANGKPIVLEFSDSLIRFIVPGGVEVSYSWTAFSKVFENEKVAVLFVQQATFHTIPKRAMGEAEWGEFRRIVQTYPEIAAC